MKTKEYLKDVFPHLVFFFSMLFLIFCLYTVVDAKGNPSDTLIIKTIQSKQDPVPFPHLKHNKEFKIECKTCHHKDDKGKEQSCFKCHKEKSDGNTKASEAKKALHNNCQNCHKDHKKKKTDTKAPVTCKACHKK